jgi:hypothetical protein
MVWAAEFVRAMADWQTPLEAARSSVRAVSALRNLQGDAMERELMTDADRAMLDDMLGVPR